MLPAIKRKMCRNTAQRDVVILAESLVITAFNAIKWAKIPLFIDNNFLFVQMLISLYFVTRVSKIG